jgi:heme exporter protein C
VEKRRLTYIALIVAGVLTLVGFLLAFFVATPSQTTSTLMSGGGRLIGGSLITHPIDFGQKIFYFHVPVAIASFAVFFFAAYFAVRFLTTREPGFDARSRIAMEVTLIFVILTMLTGDLWTRWAWGVWWVWEPRLTTYFILTLLVIAYFVLRSSVDEPERRAVYSAVFCIIAFIDAPVSFAITRLVPSELHPVVIGVPGGLDGTQLAAFLISMFGMLAFAFVIYELRWREEQVRERLEVLKSELGD